MAIIKKAINNRCWRGCGGKGSSYSVDGNINWCNHCGDPQVRNKVWSSDSTPGLYPGKTIDQKDTCTQCSWQHYLEYLRHGSKPGVHWQMNGQKWCGRYTQWNVTQP